MRKKLLALVAMLCMVLSMVGCSAEATNYSNKLKEVAAWEGQEETGNMAMDITIAGQKIGFKADYTAYINAVDNQAEMTFTVKEVSASGATLDTTKGNYKISPVKMYVTNTEMYISTTPIKEIAAIANVDLSKVEDLKKAYIGLDMKDYLKSLGIDEKTLKKQDKVKASWEMLESLGIELPVKQDKDTYTVELNADQMITAVFKLVNKSMEENKALLTAEYKQLGMTDEQIKQAFEAIQTVYGDETKAEAIKAMKDSTAKLTSTFAKDSYTTKVDVAIKATVADETIVFNMTMNDTVKKVAKKAVEMPKDAKVYTVNDLMTLATTTPATAETKAK